MIRTFILLLLFGSVFLFVACAGEDAAATQSPAESGPLEPADTESSATQSATAEPDDSQPAVAEGTVFEDLNYNGQLDEGEPGLAGLNVTAQTSDGRRIVVGTDSKGYFRFEEPFIQHRITVNTSIFPADYVLTTEMDFYDTNVMPGNIRSELNFGYTNKELSSILGIVYDDVNSNGRQDEGERGLAEVTVLALAHDESIPNGNDITNNDGRFRFDFSQIDHEIMVDESTLPAGYVLSSERDAYPLFVPTGFAASDIDFGFRAGAN
jgi:hypothetical protein